MYNRIGIIAYALMLIPMMIFIGCTYKDNVKHDAISDLSEKVLKSHEDLEIDIKAKPSEK